MLMLSTLAARYTTALRFTDVAGPQQTLCKSPDLQLNFVSWRKRPGRTTMTEGNQ